MPTDKAKHAKNAQTSYRIKVSRSGPYLVYGGIPLAEQIVVSDANGGPVSWREGKTYPAREKYALCRCGQSEKWPFCDQSHSQQQGKRLRRVFPG